MEKYSRELEQFARDKNKPLTNNGSSGEIAVTIKLNKDELEVSYNTTIEIQDDYSKTGRNKLYINEPKITQKLGYEIFTSGYNYIFEYENGVLKFQAAGYAVEITAL